MILLRNTIILIEDDRSQAEAFVEGVEAAFGGGVDVTRLRNESEARDKISGLCSGGARLFVVDVMLPWAAPSPSMAPPPPEVAYDGYYNAGLRLQREIKRVCPDAKIVLYTVLDEDTVKDQDCDDEEVSSYVCKTGEMRELIDVLRNWGVR